MSKFDALKITGDIAIQMMPVNEIFRHDNTDEAASLTKAADELWVRGFPAIVEATYSQQTEDDPENHFDDLALTRVQKQNTTVIGRTYTLQLERTNAVIEAMIAGVRDPLNADLTEGVEVDVFANNDPYIDAAFKLSVYDKRVGLLQTIYFYGSVRADGEKQYNGKLQRPQLTIEVSASVHNKTVFTKAVSGDAAE